MAAITQAERERRDRLYEIGLKDCTSRHCPQRGPLPLRSFGKRSDGFKGLYSRCRVCVNADTSDYQKRNPEKLAERVRNWNAENPDRAHLIAKRYRVRFPERERNRHRRHRKAVGS